MPQRLLIFPALCVALTGCAATEDPPCPAPVAAPPAQTALLPANLSFTRIGTITAVHSADRHISVRAVADKPIDELTVLIQDAVTAAGYRPAGMDNEGFEAEVFFTAGAYAAGQAVIRPADCPNRWDIELVLIDPETVPE